MEILHLFLSFTSGVKEYIWHKHKELSMSGRVDMAGTNHNKVLTQRGHMPMGQFRANIFFDTNYFHLLLGLRNFQKLVFLKLTILFCQYF